MKLTMSNHDKKLLLYLGAVLLPVLVYIFVFMKVQNAASNLKAENKTLSDKVDELEMMTEQKDYYVGEIEVQENRKAEIIKEFPAQILQEDQIVFARDLTNTAKMEINQVSFAEPEQFAEMDDGLSYMTASRILTGLSFRASYDSLKKALEFILSSKDRITVENISVSYDNSTGNLSGTMTVNMYAVSGTDRTYTAPNVPGVPIGTPNIFQTSE